MEKQYYIGVDIGGTFTDAVAVDETGAIWLAKALSTPSDLSMGVVNCLDQLAEQAGVSVEELLKDAVKVAHGTTATVNAMVQRRGARTGLITTRGFKDHLVMMKASRGTGLPEVEKTRFSRVTKPEPLVPLSLTEEVTERVDYRGRVVVPLDEEDARRAIRVLLDKGVEAIAVSLLWSFMNTDHERRIRKLVLDMAPNLHVSVGSDLVPVMGEYERTNTTVTNSFLGPILSTYVNMLQSKLAEKGFGHPVLLMQSDGGLIPGEKAPETAVTTLLSGLAAGVIGAKYLGECLGHQDLITIDMGGTSFEVGIVFQGQPVLSTYPLAPRMGPYITRWRLAVPSIDITAIGAGGGSIAWLDKGVLRVGPTSAGADPGPACYDRGGTEPTVTDAFLILGYLNPQYLLGGRMKISREKAESAIQEKIAGPLGIDVVSASRGIYEITTSHMADLMRKVTVERGHDPRQFALMAFGGMGPMHSCVLGEQLGVSKIIIPGAGLAQAHSAFGLEISDLKSSQALTDHLLEPIDVQRANENLGRVESAAIDCVRQWGVRDEDVVISRSIDMRFRRQTHEVEVPVDRGELTSEAVEPLFQRFESQYEMLYGEGAAFREAGIELVTFRASATGVTPKVALKGYPRDGSDPSAALRDTRPVFFDKYGDFVPTRVFDGHKLHAGNIVDGPAVIEYAGTTVVVHPDKRARLDEYLNLIFGEE